MYRKTFSGQKCYVTRTFSSCSNILFPHAYSTTAMMHEKIMPPRSTMKTPPMLASPICALVAAAPYGEKDP